MNERTLTLPELRREGLRALQERLGPAGTIRFLQLFDAGVGDYTSDRHQLLDDLTIEGIAAELEKRRRTA